MVPTLLESAGAEHCLQQAAAVIDLCDPNDFRTALLRDDNGKMLNDIKQWRIEKGLVGKDDGEPNKDEETEVDHQSEGKLDARG